MTAALIVPAIVLACALYVGFRSFDTPADYQRAFREMRRRPMHHD